MIRVLIVDDSAVARQSLQHILESDPELVVAGVACNGLEALRLVQSEKPDAVTMDLNMPGMDGLEATRRIMETHPVPIAIVSSQYDPREAYTSFRAIEAGALMVLPRPLGPDSPDGDKCARSLVSAIKTIAGVEVIRRRVVRTPAARDPSPATAPARPELVCIGASTGGPMALKELLDNLPREFPVPIAMVQHIMPGFCEGFIEWLGQSTGRRVLAAEHGVLLRPGHVYVAPDGRHFEVTAGPKAVLTTAPPDSGLRPSVKRLFQSAAAAFPGRVAAVLLSGMGSDGAEEMRTLRATGALTIAQDQESSVIHAMPGEAIRLGAVMHVLPPNLIAVQLALSVKPKQESIL
jgi:two-component system chemotaxis response regulator CheB